MRKLIVVFLALVLASCGGGEPPYPLAYANSLAAWKSKGATNYHFTLGRSCFCGPSVDPSREGLVVVTVRDSKVVGGTFVVSGLAVGPQDPFFHLLTLEELYQAGATVYGSKEGSVGFTVDPVTGLLRTLFLDYSKMMADEEEHFDIKDFAAD